MKKHDEGYVLAYVMVILAVLMVIALSVMSVSLTNIQRQRADIERMQDKYAAEGAIERAIQTIEKSTGVVVFEQISFHDESVDEIKAEVVPDSISNAMDYTCRIRITARCGACLITCEVKTESQESISKNNEDHYRLKDPKILGYESYKISTVTETEGGGEHVPG